ncbi:hypothetical protein MPER_06326, partial [Moniliophthora perniciosa FA553]
YVRIYWVDLVNIRRCRLLPIKYFKELIRSNRPRMLTRCNIEAQKTCKANFLVGFETEFILLSSTRPVTASNVHQWSGSGGFLAGSKEAVLLEEIGDAMQLSGLSLQLLHSEAAPGQYEVVSGPLTPLDAADQVIFTVHGNGWVCSSYSYFGSSGGY